MKIQIKATNLELTPPMKTYIEEKIGSIEKGLKRYDENNSLIAAVEIGRTSNHHHKGDVYYAEVTLPLPDKVLRAEVTDNEIHLAVNKAKGIINRELRKYKTARIFKFKRRRK
ncbi:MAG: ribosome-associated translation inhibitor RaiA [bacterium]|nr:ribosome-associated translation inhibitor RaiA [bacterium]MDZ4209564.1 ribosome-associated translation inhibitor RaiA [Candidatus Curtissbacteria bacterium]